MALSPTKGTIYENSGAVLMARATGNSGAAVTQASLSSITYKVFDASSTTPYTAIASGTLTIGSVIFDTLQTGAPWTADSTGYNFLWTAPASAFANLSSGLNPDQHTYRVEILFTPTSGEVFWAVFELTGLVIRSV